MIRLVIDGHAVLVTRQIGRTRTEFTAALRVFGGTPHVEAPMDEVEVVDVVGVFDDPIPDVDRFRIAILGDGGRYMLACHPRGEVCPRNNRFNDLRPRDGDFDGTVVVVLESPHCREYVDGDVNRPIAPAQGRTGGKIASLLGVLLNAAGNADLRDRIGNNFRVLIVNPVPFQTSLWCIHEGNLVYAAQALDWRTLRNAIWKTHWEHESSADFCNRLERYAPSVILNCCTGGEGGIQGIVTRRLSEMDCGAVVFRAPHPSMWGEGTQFRLHGP